MPDLRLVSDLGESMTGAELRSIDFADADGWRCYFPLTRGHLTCAQARAVLRAERGLPGETPAEALAAEQVLAGVRADGGPLPSPPAP